MLFWALGRTQQLVAWLVGRRVEDLSLVQRGLAGSAAATCSGLVLCPTELVKCRLQAAAQLGQQGGVIRFGSYIYSCYMDLLFESKLLYIEQDRKLSWIAEPEHFTKL